MRFMSDDRLRAISTEPVFGIAIYEKVNGRDGDYIFRIVGNVPGSIEANAWLDGKPLEEI